MRHLLITLGFPPEVGGMQQFLYARCQAFDPNEVVVLAPDAPGAAAFDAQQSFNVYRWNPLFKRIPGIRRVVQVLLPMYHTWRIYRSQGFDVIECGQALPCGLVALVFKILLGTPYAVWVHGNDILKPQRWLATRWLLTEVLRRAVLLVANSQHMAKRISELGIQPPQITVIHPPVDLQRFHPNVDPRPVLERYGKDHRKIILTVARLFPRKGIDTVICALPRVLQKVPDVTYIIVGDGPDRQRLTALVNELGLRDHVFFAGQVPDADLPAYYAACDVFVMLSRTIEGEGEIEGFGIVYLEAGACGKPVVGGNDGGAKEAIIDGVTGFVVNPQDLPAVAQTITQVLLDTSLAYRLGKEGQRRASQPTDWTPLKRIAALTQLETAT